MESFYQDNHDTLYCEDFRKNELPDESVQTVCCSPPYWGLRKYSGEQDLIWGDNHCEHEWGIQKLAKVGRNDTGTIYYGDNNPRAFGGQKAEETKLGSFCSLCGAWKGAYGLEPTPEMYVQHTVEILREIRRVLRKDGVVFWNIGDSYGSGKGTCFNPGGGKGSFSGHGDRKDAGAYPLDRGNISMLRASGLKPKDLCLIPFRVAIALQEDGWWVRRDIIWSKPNPMPESVTDRPTGSHEYLLMLTKSGKSLYWTHRDGKGTREKPKADYRWLNQITDEEVAVEPPDWKVMIKCPKCEATGRINVYLGLDVWQETKCSTCNGKGKTQLWKRINLWKGHDYYWDADAVREKNTDPQRTNFVSGSRVHGLNLDRNDNDLGERSRDFVASGRNIRSVWEFNEDDEQGDNFYRVLQGCPIHSPLLHPDIQQTLQGGELQDYLLSHTLDMYGRLVLVPSFSLTSKLYHTNGGVHLSNLGFHHHETECGQIVESIGDNRMLSLCCPDGGHKYGRKKVDHTKHIQKADGSLFCNSDYSRQCDELTATLRSKEIRKTVSLIATNDSVFLKIPSRTVHILRSLGCICSYNYYTTSHFPLQDVWSFPTQPFKACHFAVFPEKLPETCIKAATPEVGCCSKCGAPWERLLSKGFTAHDGQSKTAYTNEEGHNANQLAKLRQAARARGGEYQNTKQTLGWQPTCKCNADKVPSIVLDPFSGAGTTLKVAKKLNRRAIGFDTSEEYCRLTVERLRQQVMG